MSKFKVGDRVKIVREFKQGTDGSTIIFNTSMHDELGKVGTVVSLHSTNGKFFIVKPDSGTVWTWHESSLELEYENAMPELTTGMRVELRCGMNLIVIKDLEKFYKDDGFMPMSKYDLSTGKNIDYEYKDSKWDIIKVYQGYTTSKFLDIENLGKMIWEKTDPIKEAKIKRRNEIDTEIALLKLELDGLSEY